MYGGNKFVGCQKKKQIDDMYWNCRQMDLVCEIQIDKVKERVVRDVPFLLMSLNFARVRDGQKKLCGERNNSKRW